MAQEQIDKRKKVRIASILAKKERGEKLSMLTAYDFYTAKLLDQAGIDMILVGDSAAMVVHGHKNTLPITTETMLDHTSAVTRGCRYALVIADLPFMSYHVSREQAIVTSGRFIKDARAEAVKLEGGLAMVDTVGAIVRAGIPVMGHVGLSFQAIHAQSGARVQGRRESDRGYLLEFAQALDEAGVFSIVLELVQSDVAAEITEKVKAPTIGIGAGKNCDGQVLVTNDILGLYDALRPKFVRQYANLSPVILDAAKNFISDVKSGQYPDDSESFSAE